MTAKIHGQQIQLRCGVFVTFCFLVFFNTYLEKNCIFVPPQSLSCQFLSLPSKRNTKKCLFDENGVTKRQFFLDRYQGKLEHEKNTSSEKFGFKKKQNKKLSNLHLFKSRTLAHH